MRLLLPLLALVGLLAAGLILLQRGAGGPPGTGARPGPGGPPGPLAGDPLGARAIQDARPPPPPSPQRAAWRWTATILGITIVSAAVLLGLALTARALWDF